jgi:hypothetical protein
MNRRQFALGLPPLLLACRRDAEGEPRPDLAVYNAVSGQISVVRGLGTRPALTSYSCLRLGRWNVRVAVRDGYLITLDTESRTLHAVLLETVRALGSGRATCHPGENQVALSLALRSGEVPYRALLHGDRLYVDYFGQNLVEVYAWSPRPEIAFLREIRFPHPRPLGLSDLAVEGDELVVAAAALTCFSRHCPDESYAAPQVYFVPLEAGGMRSFPGVQPENVNASGLYRHPASGALYVIKTGNYRGGHGSLQRLLPGRRLGSELVLPAGAAPARAFPLDADTFLLLQMSGEHVFLVDARQDRLKAPLRFDGRSFVAPPPGPVPDRAAADFQDLLADPIAPDRFHLVDSRGDRLVTVRFTPPARLEVVATLSLKTAAFRTGPAWALWL